jgi:hypothetical protein
MDVNEKIYVTDSWPNNGTASVSTVYPLYNAHSSCSKKQFETRISWKGKREFRSYVIEAEMVQNRV